MLKVRFLFMLSIVLQFTCQFISALSSQDWILYKEELNLTFNSTSDEQNSLNNFRTNEDYIEKHNKNSNTSYKLKTNKKTHYSNKEFKKKFLMDSKVAQAQLSKERLSMSRSSISKSKDMTKLGYLNWNEAGFVSPVSNQETCGACYAFATASAVESALAIKKKQMVYLSAQQLIDCTVAYPYKNSGCNGGNVGVTLQYISKYGLESQNDYQYMDKQGRCKYSYSKARYTITNYSYSFSSVSGITNALINYGPVVAYLAGETSSFQFYSSGIYNDPLCPTQISRLDHVVLIVGFGTDNKTNQDYWLAKNSWGKNWGENGYVRIARGQNTCGIESAVYFPIA